MRRRNLLRAALAAPAVAAVAADAAEPADRFDRDSPSFTLAVLPDTQYLFDADSADPAPLRATLTWLLEHRAERNIAFLAGLGDVTEHGTEAEIALAGSEFDRIGGRLPFTLPAGNHDVPADTDDSRGDTPFRTVFRPVRGPTLLDVSPDGYSSAHRITAAGRRWLILALDWRLSPAGLDWARAVLGRHPSTPAVVTTHDLAQTDGAGGIYLSGNGNRLFDELIRGHDQIFLTVNGHDWPPGRGVLTNDAGHDVHVHVANYQDRYYGGAAMIRLYRFDLQRHRIDVETFAPWLLAEDPAGRTPLEGETAELTGDADRFSIEIDFDRRFGRPLPQPRPAEQVVDAGTVAYWRFDAAGQAVTDGAVVRDLSGNGNDLFVRRLANSPANVLTRSADHHEDAPAHASLRFDGGQDPDRGAILHTGPAAALNSLTFTGGYTIEVFVKLPEPFAGAHDFMGVLGWQGRAGDAGKHSGWSPLEQTCSLNVSGERFLQYVVYTSDGDHNPTSWSHALPTGVWQHVAVVNDGRRTVIWVNGSRIARNPDRPSRGIATVGRPFVLGATAFDLRYGQGFYGWIGDVRITGRALAPAAFLSTPHLS